MHFGQINHPHHPQNLSIDRICGINLICVPIFVALKKTIIDEKNISGRCSLLSTLCSL